MASSSPSTEPGNRLDALIDLLLTVGYVDGLFHEHEQAFIRGYLDKLSAHVALGGDPAAWRRHFDGVYARLDAELGALSAEVVAVGDGNFINHRLKVRAIKLFRELSPVDQAAAFDLLGALVQADGTVSAGERQLHDELVTHFHPAPPAPSAGRVSDEHLEIHPPGPQDLKSHGHPLLDPIERRYATDTATRQAEVGADYDLIFGAIAAWERHRARGNGRLIGVTDISQVPVGSYFLDGHVQVLRPDRPTELVVLGDLHGCYSCLKAALLQSDFIERVHRFQADPANHPDVKLVLLGDYLDRGRFSFEGVLRAALQLLVALPNHVILLRGNHELLVRHGGTIVSAVKPCEAVPAIAEHVSIDVLEAYRHLFEHMPSSLLFDRMIFVHAGIPRDDTFAERYVDLASLDDPLVRFQMMWSDPADTDHVPVELQRESSRYHFGRDQFRAFMDKIGCHTMIRGHEQVDVGFKTNFDLGRHKLHTLFSSGGHDNPDLPDDSRYRTVVPMALTIEHAPGVLRARPWPLRWQPFVTPEHNGFYR